VSGPRSLLSILLCATVVGGALVAAPASARAECAVLDGGLVAGAEDAALALAAACGVEVRIADRQDYAVRWFAEPDGRVRTESYAAAQWALDADSLVLLPDTDLLKNPDLRYPLYIDPKFAGKISQWANLHHGTNGQFVNQTT
jgi:hypothetical protein